jgi:uncharacterized protein
MFHPPINLMETNMSSENTNHLSWDEWDERNNPPPAETDFDRVVENAVSRRGFLGLLAFGSAASALGLGAGVMTTKAHASASRFAFNPIPIATDSTVHVPEGYKWQVLAGWGDPLFSTGTSFDHQTGGTAASSELAFGDNTDGMDAFNIGGKQVIAVNHEYTNLEVLHPKNEKGMPASAEDVLKTQNVQGISVMEIALGADGWSVVKDSPFNRRITHNTPMSLSGPAAGHDLLKTEADPTGMTSLGTFNNCGSGKTPWGTYLTCEENFNGYFGSTKADIEISPSFKRYGIAAESRYAYEKFDARFDISKNPNEPNRAGYVVEINPADAKSVPVKRTALGRFKHENAECVVARDGRVVVYLGDDERGEFLYRFVSNGIYVPGGDTSKLLDEGVLSVAKFNDDGSGTWIALTPEATGMSAAEVCINTRMAASKVGATTMDRPEWVAVNPVAIEGYCALTNNSNRGKDGKNKNAGGDLMDPNAVNPRKENEFGQIVRWYPANEDHADPGFKWDLYLLAGNPTVHQDDRRGSTNINAGNMFNSPDCVKFDSSGLLWIQTDGEDTNEGDFAGQGNNQMLAGDPATGRVERFLTGPKGAEITGLTWSSDRRTMFVGVQHPSAPFPDGEGKLPRSAIIAITRMDDARIG